jgi:lipopolysaccharide export system protein LptA
VLAQKVTRVELLQSDAFIGLKRNGENTNKVIRPVFKQDNATLTCDSAYFYLEKNSFEAFGNVHIDQGDSLDIYSDHLNYDGNTKLALLKSNVRLKDREALLTTNDFDYNLGTKIGQYYNGGKIVNGKNVLTSERAYYFTNTKDAYFRYKVDVKSPEVNIKSDTLKYNTFTKVAYFFGPTNIYGKTDTLYTENGQYNTLSDQASFGKRNLYTQNSKSLKGDSLFYDGKLGFGRAVKNIVFIDTAQKIELKGDLGIYKKSDESIMVTNHAYLVLVTEKDSVSKDSIWMSADTLRSRVLMKKELYHIQQKAISLLNQSIALKDSLKFEGSNNEPIKADSTKSSDHIEGVNTALKLTEKVTTTKSIKGRVSPIELKYDLNAPILPIIWPDIKTVNFRKLGLSLMSSNDNLKVFTKQHLAPEASDTTKIRVISAYKKVKVFKSDLQAIADSLFFSYGDSVLRFYQDPIVWAQGGQLSADTLYLQMKNKKIDNIDLMKDAIVVNVEKDSTQFNQVAGKTMKGFFKDDKLDVVFVNGNAESIYFPQDTSENKGMMRSVAAKMRINFRKDSLLQISFIRQPEHNYYPFEKITEELRTLPNFNWKPKDRPKSKEEVIYWAKPIRKSIPKVLKKAKVGTVTPTKKGTKPLMKPKN